MLIVTSIATASPVQSVTLKNSTSAVSSSTTASHPKKAYGHKHHRKHGHRHARASAAK
jgi:hypothetical protein